MGKYILKSEIVNGFLMLGVRPSYFNQEGRMDNILRGATFEADPVGSVLNTEGGFIVSIEDAVEILDAIDNRKVRQNV